MTDEPDLTIRRAQKHQPWAAPYSDGIMEASAGSVPHILGTHAALHAVKTVGKLCAAFEAMDHPPMGPRPGAAEMDALLVQRRTIRAASADLVTAALRLANLYTFDLQDALTERVIEKNGRGFDPVDPAAEPQKDEALAMPKCVDCGKLIASMEAAMTAFSSDDMCWSERFGSCGAPGSMNRGREA